MKQEIFLIYSKTDLRAVHQYNAPNVVEGFKNFQIFVQNQIQQNSRFMPVRFDDYVLLNVGFINHDFTMNNNLPLVAYPSYIVVTKNLVQNYINELAKSGDVDLSRLGSQIYDFEKEMNKKIEESNKK